MTEIREIPAGETALAWPAMSELRPHAGPAEAFSVRVDRVQREEGYRLAGAFEAGTPEAAAVAGFRLARNLSSGDHLYVDDLVTRAAARGRGHARALLDWLAEEATRLGCRSVQLDSGVGPERADAHRLYFGAGMRIVSYHFARRIGP